MFPGPARPPVHPPACGAATATATARHERPPFAACALQTLRVSKVWCLDPADEWELDGLEAAAVLAQSVKQRAARTPRVVLAHGMLLKNTGLDVEATVAAYRAVYAVLAPELRELELYFAGTARTLVQSYWCGRTARPLCHMAGARAVACGAAQCAGGTGTGAQQSALLIRYHLAFVCCSGGTARSRRRWFRWCSGEPAGKALQRMHRV